ncbi:hypothetical protein K493DRAFT_306495 [Basidiobolus meristosporus CBS 931.73]|uniref:PX domain-containing protein n=1 Tax=Basidiobolus meristosporus CBS 931.73 TaxID=1314790 RepID=A0A1Y1XS53_9FUNG|nr:hypothetical protein K493DRAFT_306495 [Basidiobolus meristosporus CBS 931.73]|eukprot:ORX88587.1 hypothetical protein K493DRAFT_306495 [Basidiobolus meristosporus CBS 931.73]
MPPPVTRIDTEVVKLAPLISTASVTAFEKRSDKKRWFTVTVAPADFGQEGEVRKSYSIYRTQEHFVQLSTRLHKTFASQEVEIPELQLPQRTFLLLAPSGTKVCARLNSYVNTLFQYPVYVAASSMVLEFFGVWRSDVEYVRKCMGSQYPDYYCEDDDGYYGADSAAELNEKLSEHTSPTKSPLSPRSVQQSPLNKKSSLRYSGLMNKYKPLARSGTFNSADSGLDDRPSLRRSKSAMLSQKSSQAPWNRVKRDIVPVKSEPRSAIVAPWNLHYIESEKVRDLLPSLPTPASPYLGPDSTNGSLLNLSRSNTLRRAGTISRIDSCRSTVRTLRKATSTNSLSAAARREAEPVSFLKAKVVLDEDTIVVLRIHRNILFEDLQFRILLKLRTCGKQFDNLDSRSLVYRLSDAKAFLVTGEKELNSALAHGVDRVTFYFVQVDE